MDWTLLGEMEATRSCGLKMAELRTYTDRACARLWCSLHFLLFSW